MLAALSIDGVLVAPDEAAIHADDRGWALGDGVFETVRVHRGRPLLLDAHLRRLAAGARVFQLPLPSHGRLIAAIDAVLAASQLADAVLRVSLSRGRGQRGLGVGPEQHPRLVIAAHPFAPYPPRWYAQGARAVISSVRRNERSPLSSVKSLSYGEQVLARLNAQERGADLALQLNTRDRLVSADCANLFVVFGRRVVTPPVADGALPGTARDALLALGMLEGWTLGEASLTEADLGVCDEAVLTNVLLEAAPLVRVDEIQVGDGQPGPVAALLRRAFRESAGLAPETST